MTRPSSMLSGLFRTKLEPSLEILASLNHRPSSRYVVRFRAMVYIFSKRPIYDFTRPPSAKYLVELETSGTNYKKRVADFVHEVKPGETDRFLIRLQVKQPSNHRFRVTFCNADGQAIQTRWIRLRCFVPRTRPGSLEAEKAPDVKPA